MKETIKRLNKGSLILWGIALVVFVFSYDVPSVQEIVTDVWGSIEMPFQNFGFTPEEPTDFVN